MTSTITVPGEDMVVEAKLAAVFTAAKADVVALQAGTSAVSSTVSAGTDLAVTVAAHNGKTILLDSAGGADVTLPLATGSGAKYQFLVTVATTAADTATITATGSTFVGVVFGARVETNSLVTGFAPSAANNKITLDHAAKGGLSPGEWLEIEDIAATLYAVSGQLTATGAAFGTPFSTV